MKINNLTKQSIFIFLAIISSCTKEEADLTIDTPENKGMLVFNSIEEYNDALIRTNEFNHEELVAWEDINEFKSFGRASEEIFFGQNFENFKAQDDFNRFVKGNSQFVELIKEEGEYTLDVKYYNCPERYLMNEDRMYQVADTVYKVFTNGTAYVESRNVEILSSISGDIFKPIKSTKIGFIESSKKVLNTDKSCYGGTDRATSGRERVRIKIYQERLGQYAWDKVSVHAEIRPYRKTLGVWYWCKRSISGELKWKYKFYDYEWITETEQWNSDYKSFISVDDSRNCPPGAFATFAGYDFKARIPATDYARLECNIGIFN